MGVASASSRLGALSGNERRSESDAYARGDSHFGWCSQCCRAGVGHDGPRVGSYHYVDDVSECVGGDKDVSAGSVRQVPGGHYGDHDNGGIDREAVERRIYGGSDWDCAEHDVIYEFVGEGPSVLEWI